jgi:GNAT superfamily N-acetyltransferase
MNRETQTIEVTITHLQMFSLSDLRPSPPTAMQLIQAEVPCPELNRFLYTSVGGPWYWIDRLPWTYAEWTDYLDRDELTTWVGYWKGTPAGFFELHQQDGEVEIAYFGLLPQFIGQGLGGDLLTRAIRQAWTLQPNRVWVYTCNLDGPAAIHNYTARGLKPYRTTSVHKCLPINPPGPWPGHE